jgi:hypothetical protein
MALSQTTLQRSQLGRLLVARKLLTQAQLESVVLLQQSSGKRLGEVIVDQGWVTQRQIDRALRQQSVIRWVAVLAATFLIPFQMARAGDLAPAGSDFYNPTQKSLINTFENQSVLHGNAGNPDLGNIANVSQHDGEANLAIILQLGSDNLGSIEQSGGLQNSALIRQDGNTQFAAIVQSGGSRNVALVAQR